jgi:hypothetical protein
MLGQQEIQATLVLRVPMGAKVVLGHKEYKEYKELRDQLEVPV